MPARTVDKIRIREREGFSPMRNLSLQRVLLWTGLGLFAAVIVELALWTAWRPDEGLAVWRGLGIEMVAGREASMPVALAGGAPPWFVAQVSFAQDIGAVCLAYPVFLLALDRYHDRKNWAMGRLRELEARAQAHRKFARRWGPAGIFLFMLAPFLINGPLIGALVGRIAGIRTKFLIVPVVAATIIGAFAWAYMYDGLLSFAAGLHPAIPPILTIAIVAIVLSWGFSDSIVHRVKARKN